MPSIITHNLFGLDVLEQTPNSIGNSREETDAFLLGNQGPDVFFFSALNPSQLSVGNIGSQIHHDDAAKLLATMIRCAGELAPESAKIAYAYIQGMLCHYLLDSTMHPFIYAQQYEICDAGIDGLDRKSAGHEVHAEIESELDVLLLSHKTNRTINDAPPSRSLLRGSDFTLASISAMWQLAIKEIYNKRINEDAFASSVYSYRLACEVLYSPDGVKRAVLGKLERLFRKHSMAQAMSHRNMLLYESDFDNRERCAWIDPATSRTRTESFWDLYERALTASVEQTPTILSASVSDLEKRFAKINFDGMPTAPLLIEVETL